MVYGMFALMSPECRKKIPPPGQMSVRDLYIKFAEIYIQENEHPEECILNHTSRTGPPLTEVGNLPSWCPDMSALPATETFANAGLHYGPVKQLFDKKVQGFSAGFDLNDRHWRPEKKSWTKSEFRAPALASNRKEIFKSDGTEQLRFLPGISSKPPALKLIEW